MVLVPVGNAQYVGLSGDRPLVGIVSGSRFTDATTAEESYWNGSFWNQAPRSVFSGSSFNGIISGNPTFVGTVRISGILELSGTSEIHFRRSKIYENVETGEGSQLIHVTSNVSGKPLGMHLFPNHDIKVSGITACQIGISANDYSVNRQDYDACILEAVNLNVDGVRSSGSSKYRLAVITDGVNGFLHKLEIGMNGVNRLIFEVNGDLNLNSMPLLNMKLGADVNVSGYSLVGTGSITNPNGASLDLENQTFNGIPAFRGSSAAGLTLRANPATTDATERTVAVQALDASSDTFITALTVTPNGATPRVTVPQGLMVSGAANIQAHSGWNWTGAVASGKSDTAANSGFFAPAGYITMTVSGVSRKIPYFAT